MAECNPKELSRLGARISSKMRAVWIFAAPEKGSSPEPEAPTAAESLTASGQPVSHPSGTTPGLTPSNAQIAEARSLAGGKVEHSCLCTSYEVSHSNSPC